MTYTQFKEKYFNSECIKLGGEQEISDEQDCTECQEIHDQELG